MVSILSLWLPILLSAIGVFVLSSLIHMVLGYHKNDFTQIPNEEEVMNDLRKYNIPPGEYVFPYAGSSKALKSPEFLEKVKRGPVAFITVLKSGKQNMTQSLVLWFLYSIVVSIFTAYIAGRALPAGAPYLSVFRFAGATAFIGYSVALWQNSIWFKRSWLTTLKNTFDGLLYALLTAGIFGWLWL